MTKQDIFDQVVQWAREDSATKKDTLGADPAIYRLLIREEMPDAAFVQVVNRYLNTFHCLHHLAFHDPRDQRILGFRLRYHEGCLYVTKALPASRLQLGDKILALDGQSVDDFWTEHPDYFASRTPERQGYAWASYVAEAKELLLERDGARLHLSVGPVREEDIPEGQPFVFKQLTPETVYLKMENFADEKGLAALYQESLSAIEQSKSLIIDVRVNHGGTDSLYFPLLPYLLPEGQTLNEATAHVVEQQEILYTERSVDQRLAKFEQDLANPDLSKESRLFLEAFSKDLLAHRGQGYVLYEEDGAGPQARGLAQAPERVVILSDVTCGSSGDNFVWNMGYLPKVTIMGRATMGIMDYANCFTVTLGDYELLVPTSRYLGIDEGRGLTDKGIAPDIWIDWTPDHLVRDVDLEAALAFLGQEQSN